MIQETSRKTYMELIEEGLLPDMAERVFRLIHQYPNSADRVIAQIGHLTINNVTGRRNELVAQGCVEDAGTVIDPETGRTVHIWVIPPVISFIARPKSKNPQKRLTRFI
jgi:hypothetical protein